jgi:hypothetical protein
MIGGLTLFGFDLFGLSERSMVRKQPVVRQEAEGPSPEKEEAKPDERSVEPSESFFWGMYPVY